MPKWRASSTNSSRASGGRFDFPLAPKGTDFQKRVWAELLKIPFGETISYGELAKRVGNPNASRAVGRANATNPIALIVPCHRVIGTNGKLTGYAGGIDLKDKLLTWERSVSQPNDRFDLSIRLEHEHVCA